MSKTPRTDAVWERIATDLSLEPDVEFSTLARELEYELQEAKDRIEQLEEWKQSALAVEREWDANSIATMLGGNLGESQRKVIQREVPKLLNRIKHLEKAGKELRECANQLGWTSSNETQWIKRAEAAVKAWDETNNTKTY